MRASPNNFPLLDELLAEQQRLDTPVARFSAAHDSAARSRLDAERVQLIPLTRPNAGEQYAFEVDLDSCTGCKSCVAACHALNGLDETETWRDVGVLVSTERHKPFTQTITTACHHCADPACLNGCPVLAYEKDPLTGIVRHLDDQCIGCSYCILKCPYDVPKFSQRLGIVRKCDMCHGRLAEGEAPACAQACPTHAIRIVNVSVAPAPVAGRDLRPDSSTHAPPTDQNTRATTFLPSAPDPAYTQPTTRYISRRAIPSHVTPGDAAALRIQPPHWPLVFLLTLMPMAVGCMGMAALITPPTPLLATIAWGSGAAALALSVFHLGQPLRAWRVFLGLRRSWLSREAVVFGAWLPVATLYLAAQHDWLPASDALDTALLGGATALGMAGLVCSVMVYVDTQREFWRLRHTGPRFFGTAAVLGLATALAMVPAEATRLGLLLVVAVLGKLFVEARALEPMNGDRDMLTPARKTALLLTGALRSTNELRLAAALLGGIVVPLSLALELAPSWLAWPALGIAMLGELVERYLFFRAVDAPKMPGVHA